MDAGTSGSKNFVMASAFACRELFDLYWSTHMRTGEHSTQVEKSCKMHQDLATNLASLALILLSQGRRKLVSIGEAKYGN